MALALYNGWSGRIREIRGAKQTADVKSGKIKATGQCEVCGNTKGLTFHCEEYGSTYQDMLDNLHELCPYCHGILHLREKWPNRFTRFKHRIVHGTLETVEFDNLWAFFTKAKSLKDINQLYVGWDPETIPLAVKWLFEIPLHQYQGMPKIATIIDKKTGDILPDPTIYAKGEEVRGMVIIEGELIEAHFNKKEEA
jgi:hypothetical protein